MKHFKITIFFLLSFVFCLLSFAEGDKKKKETFKVWGSCDMCHQKITSTVKSIEGVKSCSWNVITKIMKVKFNENITTLDNIQKIIAESGYDTERFKATDKAYNSLHYCCKYERK